MPLPRHLPALDALRGIAITLVIASHAFPMAQNLPWTIKRFSNLGFFGVQLFFVVSAITLANSWRRNEQAGPPHFAFALRRVFRIGPAYGLAAAAYALQTPPAQGSFLGVPGGWSVEAELGFYVLFPVLITTLRGPARSAAAFLLSLPLAWAANHLAWAAYAPIHGAAVTGQFLYYWLPNQLPVFLTGLAAYEAALALSPGGAWERTGRRIASLAPALCGASIALFLLLAFLAWPRLPRPDHCLVPAHVLAAFAFAGLAITLILRPHRALVNRLTIAIGQASFSAYLLHFAIIGALQRLLPASCLQQAGYPAAFAGCAFFLAVFALTIPASQLTYRLIELPGIRLGSQAIAAAKATKAQATRGIKAIDLQ